MTTDLEFLRGLRPPMIDTVQAALSAPGELPLPDREAVLRRALDLSRDLPDPPAVPAALTELVDKITRHAHMVGDDDIRAVRQAGYSDDATFEAAICAALGAGLARLTCGLALVAQADAGGGDVPAAG